jgi:pimeloyl-ACP methyl ester carboxylesterase
MDNMNAEPKGASQRNGAGPGEYTINGVRVETVAPDSDTCRPQRLLFVHGGCHGSWSWEKFMPHFAAAGWECHALNWYGRNGSMVLSDEQLVQRSIADVTREIASVAGQFAQPPVLIGHSMGGLAVQKYAESHDTAALILLTPVVPAEAGCRVFDTPIDLTQPWRPPPFAATQNMFFQGLTEEEAERYHNLLCAESPRAVFEATCGSVSVDKVRVSGPILVVAAELDILTPPSTARALAELYGADYRYLRGRGHNVLLEPRWEETARLLSTWLARVVV